MHPLYVVSIYHCYSTERKKKGKKIITILFYNCDSSAEDFFFFFFFFVHVKKKKKKYPTPPNLCLCMFPVAEVLVFFLYVLLIQEIIEIFFFGPKVKDKPNYSNRTGGGSTNYQRRSVTSAAFRIHHGSAVIRIRAPILTITKSKIERVKAHSHPIEKHKSINSLDGLWRRMRQATENYRLFHKKDAMITEVMAAARKEAYDAMVKKNSEEKQKILKTNSEAEKD